MDPETGRMPVFHLDLGNEDYWFVTRDKLDEFIAARKMSLDEANARAEVPLINRTTSSDGMGISMAMCLTRLTSSNFTKCEPSILA